MQHLSMSTKAVLARTESSCLRWRDRPRTDSSWWGPQRRSLQLCAFSSTIRHISQTSRAQVKTRVASCSITEKLPLSGKKFSSATKGRRSEAVFCKCSNVLCSLGGECLLLNWSLDPRVTSHSVGSAGKRSLTRTVEAHSSQSHKDPFELDTSVEMSKSTDTSPCAGAAPSSHVQFGLNRADTEPVSPKRFGGNKRLDEDGVI